MQIGVLVGALITIIIFIAILLINSKVGNIEKLMLLPHIYAYINSEPGSEEMMQFLVQEKIISPFELPKLKARREGRAEAKQEQEQL